MKGSSKPLFKKVSQVALVVKDVEATAKRYWEDVAIGPWKFYTLDPSNTPEMTLRGKPVKHAFRAAIASVGEVELELTQPLSGESLYAEHLAVHGEGLHHVAFEVEAFDDATAQLKERGYREIQGGRSFGVDNYAYFDTDRGLACIAELYSEEGNPLPPPERTLP